MGTVPCGAGCWSYRLFGVSALCGRAPAITGTRRESTQITVQCRIARWRRLQRPTSGMRCRCIKGSSFQGSQSIENSTLDQPEIRRIKAFPLIRPLDRGAREGANSGLVPAGLAAAKSKGRHPEGHEASRMPRGFAPFARTGSRSTKSRQNSGSARSRLKGRFEAF